MIIDWLYENSEGYPIILMGHSMVNKFFKYYIALNYYHFFLINKKKRFK